MRVLSIAIAAVATFATVAAVQAQTRVRRPLAITVQPRSFLDPGKVVPVGSLNRYTTVGSGVTSPVYFNLGGKYGEDTLPPRDGIGSGRNPFGNF